jgi:hypothetical protein
MGEIRGELSLSSIPTNRGAYVVRLPQTVTSVVFLF